MSKTDENLHLTISPFQNYNEVMRFLTSYSKRKKS